MRHLKSLLFLEGVLALNLALIFSKFPIFPATPSVDFTQHLSLATMIASGRFPPVSTMALYGAVELYLALAVLLLSSSSVPAVAAIQYAMALLVLASPAVIYLLSRELIGERAALWSVALYVLSGFVWFGMVFNAGLYPNFLGVLSSIFLIFAVVRSAKVGKKKRRTTGLLLLSAAVVFALFSHYSVLLVFPPLALWLARRRLWHALAILLVPPLLLFLALPDLVSTFLSFFAPVGAVPPPTPLSSVIPLPTLSFAVAEISANWLGDYAALVVLFLAFLGARLTLRKDSMMVLTGWLAISLLFPVYTQLAWRFAIVSLVPMTLLAGISLARLAPSPFLPGARALLVLVLILVPALGSWSNVSAASSLPYQVEVSGQQRWDLQAIEWMATHMPHGCNATNSNMTDCTVISADDYNFRFLPYMGGGQAVYAPGYGIAFTDALQVQFFAASHGRYIVVSRYPTVYVPPCDPRGSLQLSLTASSSEVRPGQALTLDLRAVRGLNATVELFDNATRAAVVNLVNGSAELRVIYSMMQGSTTTTTTSSHNLHVLTLALGSVATYPLNITVSPYADNQSGPPVSVGVPPYYCQPWGSYNVSSMRGWVIIYENPDVKIWEVQV
jgi:hypothetical protein